MKEQGVERWTTRSEGDPSLGADAESSKPTLVQSPAHLLDERSPRTLPRGQIDEVLAELEYELAEAGALEGGDAPAAHGIANGERWSTPSSDEPSYVGQVIDNRYVVEALIARGGMGIVYRCRHQLIDRKFAVKIIRGATAQLPDAPRRFLMEAKAASAIGNEHIVDVVDYGTLADGSAYLVMELLEGVPLSDIIARHERLPLERIAAIASQLCEGLYAAHQAGIVHRDLKPENVFLTSRKSGDFVKILDFGIAKMMSAAEPLTKKGLLVGTPHYMSPEQAAGGIVDPRGDIYSLGVILYELATGQVPFDATHYMAVLAKHMSEPPPPFDSLPVPPKLPAEFEAIVQRCLAKRPDQRFQSMTEVMVATERLCQRLRASSLDMGSRNAVMPPPPWEGRRSESLRSESSRSGDGHFERHRAERSGPGGSVPAAAGRSVMAPARTRGLSLVLSALAMLALAGISLLRMQTPEALHGAGAPRVAAPLEPLSDVAAPAPPPARTADAAPLASKPPPPAAAPSTSVPSATVEPLTIVELAPGKSVEIEARTRLSLRLTKETATAPRAPRRRPPLPRKPASASRTHATASRQDASRRESASTPPPERSPDADPSNGLMDPWPSPAVGPPKN